MKKLTTSKFDDVNYPQHYNEGGIEAIDAIKASMSSLEFKGYLKGNALKYMWRYTYKDKPVEDLRKAKWYLEKLIESNENTS
tara:strand:- start:4955 stop:5200 length:246 start_codon:yes stop_codon:yes gene_type:complete